MVSEDRVKELMLEALKKVKEAEEIYKNLPLNDQTIVLGRGGAFDSIAFTAFATDFEEKMEDETGSEFILKMDELFSKSKGKSDFTVADLARFVAGKSGRN